MTTASPTHRVNGTAPFETNSNNSAMSATARQLHGDIENTLRSRHAPQGTLAADLEAKLKHGGAVAWQFFKRHPFVGVVSSGAIVGAAASAIGVAEMTLALAAAFTAYKVLREGEPALDAIQDLEKNVG